MCRHDLLAGEAVAASVHYIKDHYRGNRTRPPVAQPTYHTAGKRWVLIEACLLLIVLVLVVAGVWLMTGVASVGRTHDDCLESARRVCGPFFMDGSAVDTVAAVHGIGVRLAWWEAGPPLPEFDSPRQGDSGVALNPRYRRKD
jgi:hypothetical protein